MLAPRRSPDRPYVIGHRGARGHAPENTMAAFRKGAELGADLVECDVHVTRDGHLVVFHDDRLERTTGGAGLIREHSLAELRALDCGQGERIATLPELLAWAALGTVGVVVEIKNGPYFYPGVAQKVSQAIRAAMLTERAMIISFDHLVVQEAKRLAPEIATGILYHARLADPVGAARAALADSLWPSLALLTPDVSEAAHGANLGVFTWTANTPEDFERARAAKADGIGTDYPDELARTIGSSGPERFSKNR